MHGTCGTGQLTVDGSVRAQFPFYSLITASTESLEILHPPPLVLYLHPIACPSWPQLLVNLRYLLPIAHRQANPARRPWSLLRLPMP